eukprot:5069723-Pyramimonas_sp.AAC.2
MKAFRGPRGHKRLRPMSDVSSVAAVCLGGASPPLFLLPLAPRYRHLHWGAFCMESAWSPATAAATSPSWIRLLLL